MSIVRNLSMKKDSSSSAIQTRNAYQSVVVNLNHLCAVKSVLNAIQPPPIIVQHVHTTFSAYFWNNSHTYIKTSFNAMPVMHYHSLMLKFNQEDLNADECRQKHCYIQHALVDCSYGLLCDCKCYFFTCNVLAAEGLLWKCTCTPPPAETKSKATKRE